MSNLSKHNIIGFKYLFTLWLSLAAFLVHAQDLHFSQFFNNPLLTNPANTGFNPDFDYRIGASYRSQWTSLPVPYKTASIWGDVQAFRNKFTNGWMGLGGVILSDRAGIGNLNSTKFYASVAWHQELGYRSLLSGGFNVGYAAKSLDPSAFLWESQWNGRFFDGKLPNGEVFASNSIAYFDLQAGLNYAFFASDHLYVNGGVSLLHLNKPKETFFEASVGENRVPQRYTGFVNATAKLNNQWIINPNIYYSYQAGSSELVAGALAQYNLGTSGEKQVLGGLYYRSGDAVIPMVGLQWKDVKMVFSYDATASPLNRYNNGNGAIEFSITKQGLLNLQTPRNARCPMF